MIRRSIVSVILFAVALTSSLHGNSQTDQKDPNPNQSRVLSGRVVDDRGKPIAGAELRIGHYARKNLAERTDSNGDFRLQIDKRGRASIVVTAPGMATTIQRVDVNADEVLIQLQRSPVLRVRVVDENDNPIKGVTVMGDDWRDSALFVRFQTDEEGRVEWTGAPNDAVEYMISKPGHVRLVNRKLVADGTEHVIRLLRTLRLSGTVTDSATGRRIEQFTVIPVGQFESGHAFANRHKAKQGRAGAFAVVFDRAGMFHRVRIEADGYRTAMSDAYSIEQVDPKCTIALTPASRIRGVVLDRNDRPVSDATVYLATATQGLDLYPKPHRDNQMSRTANDGTFSFVAQFEQYALVAAHPHGHAQIIPETDTKTIKLVLQPWARVEGVLMQAGTPIPNHIVRLIPIRLTGPGDPVIDDRLEVRTDAEGKFLFSQVPPQKHKLMADLSIWAESPITSSRAIPLDLKPRQHVSIALGGDGAQVKGAVTLKGRSSVETNPVFSLNYLLSMRPGIDPPPKISDAGFDWRNGWTRAWESTREGVAYRDSLHHFLVKLNHDGSFHISGVPRGKYELAFNLYETPEGGCLVQPIASHVARFEVASSQANVDLGKIEVEAPPIVRTGELVPDIEYEDVAGVTRHLHDLRGKMALLDFWATWCGPCLSGFPKLRRLREQYSSNDNLVILGLNLDRDVEKARQFVRKQSLNWEHGFLGDWTRSTVPQHFGISSIPAYLVIAPDGKLLYKGNELDRARAILLQPIDRGN